MDAYRLSLTLVALALVATACDGKSGDETKPEGTNPGECSDGADNDSDGDYDCNDSDCAGAPDCEETDTDSGPIGPHGETMVGPHGGTMIRLTAGSFDMGCTAGQSDCGVNESPVMPVTLTHDYYMGETEVTQAEYKAVMGTNPSEYADCGTDCPVDNVSWHMAAAYANALSSSAGLTKCYTCNGSGSDVVCEVAMSPYDCDGYRLPTEAEWEGAARCGEDLLYAGSNDIDAVGWTYDNSNNETQPVAGKDANACGLYDMSGNVFEWTQDWYAEDYTENGRTDPEGASGGRDRVYRGGSKNDLASDARVANRRNRDPSDRRSVISFRLARTVP